MESRDLAEAATLACQLGYPTTESQIIDRFQRVSSSPDDYLCVAEIDGHVAGWIHLHVSRTLEREPHVEVLGLVVHETSRRQGIGRALMAEAERWARERGVAVVRLRSNVVRADAHAFYHCLGYRIVKTQHAFENGLSGD